MVVEASVRRVMLCSMHCSYRLLQSLKCARARLYACELLLQLIVTLLLACMKVSRSLNHNPVCVRHELRACDQG